MAGGGSSRLLLLVLAIHVAGMENTNIENVTSEKDLWVLFMNNLEFTRAGRSATLLLADSLNGSGVAVAASIRKK